MYQIDKAAFGAFVAALRRERGMTQRDLAERLFVSDKAVSKWETGVSLPDISLLAPLAEALGATAAELLAGRRLEGAEPVSPGEADALVRRVLDLTGEKPSRGGPDRRKWGVRYGLCLLLAAAEMALLVRGMITDAGNWLTYYPAALMTALSAGFGLYFCLFALTRLPWYHDVGRINMYCDGPLRMNVPGVRFTNQNWPHILRGVRIWCLLAMTGSGAVCLAAKWALGPGPVAAWLPMAFLPGLLAAVYVPGRRYADPSPPRK